MNYGIAFSEMFLDARERVAGDIQSKINLHNNHAGRMVLTNHMQVRCKCHGMSGSCQMKTCWKAAPDFRVVGSVLKQQFRRAVLVDQSNKGNGSPLIIPEARKRGGPIRRRSEVHHHHEREMELHGDSTKRMGGKKMNTKTRQNNRHDAVSVDGGDLADEDVEDEAENMADMAKCEPGDARRYCEHSRQMETSLFYYQRSPNFCERDRGAEILGLR